MAFLETEELTVSVRTKTEGTVLLRNISLQVNSGEVTALIGESGAGKTLLAKTISGLLDPERFVIRGRMSLKGKPVADWNSPRAWRGRTILYAPQNAAASLDPVMRIGKQIRETSVVSEREVRRILQRLGFDDPERIMRAYPFELSGGENQRCLFALVLAMNPELLILDEPTAELDARVQLEMMALLEGFQKDLGLTLLILTHNLFLVRKMADWIYVIRNGTILEHGDRESVLNAPVHPYTREIIGLTLDG